MAQPNNSPSSWSKHSQANASSLAGAAAVGVGALILLGWAFNIELLKPIVPGWITMKANTAVGFVLAGSVLIVLSLRRPIPHTALLVRLGAALACLLGVATLTQYVFAVDLQIDQLLFHEAPGAFATSSPGRMSPVTAVNFTLIAISLFLLTRRSTWSENVVQITCGLVAAVSLLSFSSYAYEMETQDTLPPVSLIAPHTALTFILLAVGVLMASGNTGFMARLRSSGAAGMLLRRLLPVAFLLPLVIGWLRVLGQHLGLYDTAEGSLIAAAAHIVIFSSLIWWASSSINRTEEALRRSKAELQAILDHSPALISWKDLNGVVRLANRQRGALLEGPPLEELVNKSVFDLFPPDVAGALWQNDLAALQSGGPIEAEETVKHRDGTWHTYLTVKFPLTGEDSQPFGIGAISTDITDRKEAAQVLRERGQRFENLLESAPGAIVVIDQVGHIQMVNASTEAMFGYARDELVGQPVEMLLPEHVRSIHTDHLKRFFEAPEQQRLGLGRDLAGRRRDGTEFPVEIGLSYASDEHGVAGVAFIADITERKQAEQEALTSRERLQNTLDNLMEGCQVIGFDWRYLYLNDTAASHGRRAKEELLGQTMMEMYPGIEHTPVFVVLSRCMKERVAEHMMNEFVYPDGSKGWFALSIQPVPAGLFILSADMTDHKLAEEEVGRLNAELEQRVVERTAELEAANVELRYQAEVLKSVNAAIMLTGPDFLITGWNEAAEAMLGWTAAEVIGRRGRDVFKTRFIGETGEEVIQQLLDCGTWHGEMGHAHKDGHEVFTLVSTSAIKDANGAVTGYVSVSRDITERKQTEEKISQLNESLIAQTALLEAANQELEAFSYSVSHDLRAPLRSLSGFSQILLEKYAPQIDPEAARYLEYLNQDARQMGNLIDDLLAFSRLGRQELQKQRVEPAALVKDVLEDHQDEIDRRNIKVTPGDLPACQADPALLRHVYANLISNAIKFTGQKAEAAIEIGCQQADGKQVYFVKDNGAGFDMRYADKLFGVFQRLHLPEEFDGTGVGLAIVQRIVHRHGGRVWCDAQPDVGATFYFTLEGDGSDG